MYIATPLENYIQFFVSAMVSEDDSFQQEPFGNFNKSPVVIFELKQDFYD